MYYECASKLARHGYEHYEISNYAKNSMRSCHNLKYWRDEEYIGLGLSAHSYYKGKRYYNPTAFSEYLDGKWEKYRKAENDFLGVDPFEYSMLALRLGDGIDLCEYKKRFGVSFAEGKEDMVKAYINAGFMMEKNGRLSFTDRGFYLSNSILSELI
jgi:oxygen-independent coproporphyrinogen-3 oxidase